MKKINAIQNIKEKMKAGMPRLKEELKKLKGNPFKKKWLKRLDRYIIVKFLGTYFFAIALIISIAVVFDINENIDDFINNKAPLKAIMFDYYLNFIPYYTNLFSPLFVFIAVIFFTSKLAENSEIIAMFSTGMSFKRLMVPYMISAAIIALVTYVLSTEVIPTGSVTRLKFEGGIQEQAAGRLCPQHPAGGGHRGGGLYGTVRELQQDGLPLLARQVRKPQAGVASHRTAHHLRHDGRTPLDHQGLHDT